MTTGNTKGRALYVVIAIISLALTGVCANRWISERPSETSLDVELQPKGVIMSAVYKVYGKPQFQNQWVARAIVRNTGTEPVKNMKIAYKIVKYCDWSNSPVYPLVIPGQSVVNCFYPIISDECTQLTSATPTKLLVKVTYLDNSGREQTIEKDSRIELRGRNEFLFTDLDYARDIVENFADFHMNDPLLAAWVTKDDPVVEQFVGIAQQVAGGAAAAASDEHALKLMDAVWQLLAYNGISYQTPSAETSGFSMIQHVKYPRDVLKNKSGTCIDLAITYAALLHSAGLEILLVNIPGHCFPAFRLPSGNLVGVEATALRGPGSAATFEDALKRGTQELASLKPGEFTIVDIQKIREAGITEPQLPEMPADVLKAWGIRNPFDQQEEKSERRAERPSPGTEQETAPASTGGKGMARLSHPQGIFTLMIPANWQAATSADGSMIGAQDPAGRAGVDVTVFADRFYQPNELPVITQQVYSNFAQNLQNLNALRCVGTSLGGNTAIRTDVTFNYQGKPSRGCFIVSIQNGKVIVLTTRADAGAYTDFESVFNSIIASYRGGTA